MEKTICTVFWAGLLAASIYMGWNSGPFTNNEWAIVLWVAAGNAGQAVSRAAKK